MMEALRLLLLRNDEVVLGSRWFLITIVMSKLAIDYGDTVGTIQRILITQQQTRRTTIIILSNVKETEIS